jgi:Na+/proline symporter
MSKSQRELRDQRDRNRFIMMNVARISGLALVLLGIAIARAVIELPYAIGVVLAVIGLIEFFFAPTMLARFWKAADAREKGNSRR